MAAPFFVVLPSNSTSFPNNKINKYRIKLPKVLHFDGDWICGVYSVRYTHSWNTFDNEDNMIHLHYPNEEPISIKGPIGDYKIIDSFEKELNECIENEYFSLGDTNTISKKFKRAIVEDELPVKISGITAVSKINAGAKAKLDVSIRERLERGFGLRYSNNHILAFASYKSGDASLYPFLILNDGRVLNSAQQAYWNIVNKFGDFNKHINTARYEEERNPVAPPKKDDTPPKEVPLAPTLPPKKDESPPRELPPTIPPPLPPKKDESPPRELPPTIPPPLPPKKDESPPKELPPTIPPPLPPKKDESPPRELPPTIPPPLPPKKADTPPKELPPTIPPPLPPRKNESPPKELPPTIPTVSPPKKADTPPKELPRTPIESPKEKIPKRKRPTSKERPSLPSPLHLQSPRRGEAPEGKAPMTSKELLEVPKFRFLRDQGRFTVHVPFNMYITLSDKMAYILGFTSGQKLLNGDVAKYIPDINAGIHELCIYENSGLTEYMIVGDKLTSLLRIVNVTSEVGQNVEQIYTNPIFKRVLAKEINEIEIEIKSLTNKLIPFNYGTVIVTLMFKRIHY